MRTEVKGYLLKEYGSWSVLVIAFLVGIGVSRGFTLLVFPLFLALGMLINSKQAFTKWLRKKGDHRSFVIFIGQIAVATAVLVAVFGSDVPRLLPLLVIPAAYLLMNRFAGEHFILTELLGFALLSLAAVLAKFLITNGIDVRLFVAVALYFTAAYSRSRCSCSKNQWIGCSRYCMCCLPLSCIAAFTSRFSCSCRSWKTS